MQADDGDYIEQRLNDSVTGRAVSASASVNEEATVISCPCVRPSVRPSIMDGMKHIWYVIHVCCLAKHGIAITCSMSVCLYVRYVVGKT